MLKYAPSLKDAVAHSTNVNTLATELEKAGLITKDQIRSLLFLGDAKAKAAILIGMVAIKVYSNSENFTTFLDVLKKDEATYGHILAKMKEKGVFVIIVCTDCKLKFATAHDYGPCMTLYLVVMV